MKIISRYRIATVAAAAVMGIAGLATSASADGNTLYASQGDEAHVCQVVPNSGFAGREVVACVDLLTDDQLGGPRVTGQAEIICQTTSGVEERCAHVEFSAGILANATGTRDSNASFGCGGTSEPACSSTRNYVKFGSEFTDPSGCQSNLGDNYWAVLAAGGYGIDLAGDPNWVWPDTNFSTGHRIICP